VGLLEGSVLQAPGLPRFWGYNPPD